jgi:hypothetical protein
MPSVGSAEDKYEQSLSSKPNRTHTMYFNGNALPKPDNNMLGAVLSTICCCLPLGIVAIIKASKVNTLYYSGQYEEAVLMADSARKWSIWASVAGVVVSIINTMLQLFLSGTMAASEMSSIYGI